MTENLHDAMGELRSLLAQPPSAATFQALIARADALATSDPARFESEAMPYLDQHLDRWYDACTPGGLYLAGPLAERGLLRDAPWLSLVRDLDLNNITSKQRFDEMMGAPGAALRARVKAAQPLIDALLRSRRLKRLQALVLPDSLHERVIERILRSPVAAQLIVLAADRHSGEGVSVLRQRPLPLLHTLQLVACELDASCARPIATGLSGLRDLDLGHTTFSGRGMLTLLEQLATSQLERLTLGQALPAGLPMWQALSALLAARPSLELDVEQLHWTPDVMPTIISAPALPPLRHLSTQASDAPTALDSLLMSPVGQGLRSLSLDWPTLRSPDASLSSDGLERLMLELRDGALCPALAAGRWPALSALHLVLFPNGDIPAALAPLLPVTLPALTKLSIDAFAMDTATLRALFDSPLVSRLDTLCLTLALPAEDEQIDAVLRGVDALPGLRLLNLGFSQLTPDQRERAAHALGDRFKINASLATPPLT